MSKSPANPDHESDELIRVFIDTSTSSSVRQKAATQLYQRHSRWVEDQISNKIYHRDDVYDIAQVVWMMVLNPNSLADAYSSMDGKFRAFLRKPIRWAMLKHLGKLPFTEDKYGEKSSPIFIDIDEGYFDASVQSTCYEDAIEGIIKPHLSGLDLKPRIMFVANEYDTIFEHQATKEEVAQINNLTEGRVTTLLNDANKKGCATELSDSERSVYVPTHYRSHIDPNELKVAAGRHLAKFIGVSEAVFRKQLHVANKQLIDIVRKNLDRLIESDTNYV